MGNQDLPRAPSLDPQGLSRTLCPASAPRKALSCPASAVGSVRGEGWGGSSAATCSSGPNLCARHSPSAQAPNCRRPPHEGAAQRTRGFTGGAYGRPTVWPDGGAAEENVSRCRGPAGRSHFPQDGFPARRWVGAEQGTGTSRTLGARGEGARDIVGAVICSFWGQTANLGFMFSKTSTQSIRKVRHDGQISGRPWEPIHGLFVAVGVV